MPRQRQSGMGAEAARGAGRLRAAPASNDQSVISVTKLRTSSTRTRKGQYRTKPHSDRSAKAGQQWGRHAVVGMVEACSRLTRERISIIVLGEPVACPACGHVPVWDCEGNLCCRCRIWTDPDPTQEPGRSPDAAIEHEKRNKNYQKDLRKFFKKGR